MILMFKATVILLAAWAATGLLRKSSASVREAIWSAALLSLALLPIAGALAPTWNIAAGAPIRVDATAPVASAAGFTLKLWHVWLAGAILVLARLAIGVFKVAAIRRSAQQIADPAPVAVLISKDVPTPMAWFRSILLPIDALDWTPELRQSVITHELAHVFGFDAALRILTEAICAAYWFNPLVWFAAAQRRRERELACDDQVLAFGVDPADYAQHLLGVAREVRAASLPAPCMAAGPGLEERIGAILNPKRNRRGLGHAGLIAVLAVSAAVIAPLASFAFQDDTIHKVGNGVKAPKLIYKVEPKYTDEARDAKLDGAVILSLVVRADGTASDLVVKRGLGLGLDQAAVDAGKQWKFQPATKDDKPVNVAATIEVNFRLK